MSIDYPAYCHTNDYNPAILMWTGVTEQNTNVSVLAPEIMVGLLTDGWKLLDLHPAMLSFVL